MYQDFLNDIIAYFRQAQRCGNLPQRLIQPTPAGVKAECIAVCETRFRKEDFRTLTAFFQAENEKTAMLRAIHRCDKDRFRPLVYYIKGVTQQTDDLNIELLAWLIDFPDRPFNPEKYRQSADASPIDGEELVPADGRQIDQASASEMNPADPALFSRSLSRYRSFLAMRGLRKVGYVLTAILLLGLFGHYTLSSGPVTTKKAGSSTANLVEPAELIYARCTGSSPCRACSNCNSCNWCNSGGTCSTCAKTEKSVSQKRRATCQAMTKKGTQCTRFANAGGRYCSQHAKMLSAGTR